MQVISVMVKLNFQYH